MTKTLEERYFEIFEGSVLQFKSLNIPDYIDMSIQMAAITVVKEYGEALAEPYLEGLALKVHSSHKGLNIMKPSVIRDTVTDPWFETKSPVYKYFWPRYVSYLQQEKKWSLSTINEIDKTTDEILSSLSDPATEENFDKRGLVLGYVQSGKTANFTGLINKAFDVGYQLVIVLAGIHNDLRSQTQLRLEREVVGRIDKIAQQKEGVALIRSDGEQIETWTTVDEDISANTVLGLRNLTKKILIVVKKNSNVLDNLIGQLEQSLSLGSSNGFRPATLIIDDEADQASIDTSTVKSQRPTTINGLIRRVAALFHRVAYVGYTATPFANLLIKSNAKDEEFGSDLYPKDFLVALPKPEGYCGPDEYFNTTGNEEDNKPQYIRHIDSDESNLLEKEELEIPKSMKQAIRSFLLVIVIRNLRGQKNVHNSMLIHISRLTEIQSHTKSLVNEFYKQLANEIRYERSGENWSALEELYYSDFLEIQRQQDTDQQSIEYTWKQVKETLKRITDNVEILEINGQSKEVLDYDKYKNDGLSVIAIGGNKLSRGLTLEGLSISYYYRNSTNYDTIMQMGRWFGFRRGYMDLCRIYTTREIAEHFEHLAVTMSELRQEFDVLAQDPNMTPETYAVKMLDHPVLSVTSPNKMTTATTSVNYMGTKQQTRSFARCEEFYKANMAATNKLIDRVEKFEVREGSTKYHFAYDVPSEWIIDFFSEYQTVQSARTVQSRKIAEYIKQLNQEQHLTHFTVGIVDVTKSTLNSEKVKCAGLSTYPVDLGKVQIESAVIRSVNQDKSAGTSVIDLGAIVAAGQEYADLKGKSEEKRLKRQEANPLLLIYPLHPEVKPFKRTGIKFSLQLVPIGIALSFPIIDDYPPKNYVTNSTVGEV